MKKIKYLFVFFVGVLLFGGCNQEEELSYVFQDISAPTNVQAQFDIAQDDSGEVSVTPTAEGATLFEIYYGDTEDETPTEVNPGETATHIYGEGEFNLRIVAIGMTGLTSELNRVVTISFAAPTDLTAEITQSNPLEITVTPSATNATVYDVYFGESAEEEPMTIMDGESAVYQYAAPGEYTIRIVARGAGAATSEITEVFNVEDLTNAETFPIDFESNETLTGVFEEGDGVTGSVIANPDASGINTSETVYEFTKVEGAAWYSGIFHIFSEDMDLSVDQVFKVNIWSPKAGVNVRFQIEKEGGDAGLNLFIDQTVDVAEEWVTLTYDFRGIVDPANAYDKFVLFPDFDATNQPAGDGSIYYIDDINLETPGAVLELPISFDLEGVDYDFGTFNGASYEVVDNPDPSGANPDVTKVGAITNSGAQFEGGAFNLDTPVDFSGDNKTIAMKFWSTVPVPILLKFEGGVNGERQNEVVASHTGSGWEEITFDFAKDATKSFIDGNQGVGEPFVPTGQYATMVIFIDGPGFTAGTFYMDDIEQLATSSPALELPISFDLEGVDYDFGTFNGASYEVVDNPDPSGANPDITKVGAITNSGAQFEGGAFNLDNPVDFGGDNKIIAMKFWSTVPVPILLKFEGGVNGERQNEVVANHGGSGWEELIFDFANDATKSFIDGSQGVGEPFVPTGQYASMVLFVDGPNFTAGTFYMDDIEQRAPAAPVLELPITFDVAGVNYAFGTFNGASYDVVDNPDPSGANPDVTKVGAITNSGAQFEGGAFNLDNPVDFGGDNKTIAMKFWSTVPVPILLKFEGGVNGERQNEVVANHNGNGWEELTFDFANDATKSFIDGNQGVGEPFVPSGQYATMVIFIDGPGFTAGTFYMDDINQQ